MRHYLISQIIQLVVVVIGISLITFVLLRLSGDPLTVMLPLDATEEQRASLREALGLDQPLPVQYLRYARNVLRGDFGKSLFARQSALRLVLERMPATLRLSLAGLIFALLLAIPLGIAAAIRRGSWIDSLASVVAVSGQAVPIYWLGLMLIVLFAVRLHWLPSSGYGHWAHLVLPMVTLGVFLIPTTMRLVRSEMIHILSQDYIKLLRAKGMPERTVLFRHGLRNVSIPVITVVGVQAAQLMGGSVITETVFAWPGVASLLVSSIYNRDFPLVQAAVFMLSIAIVLANMTADVLIAAIDPRIRLG